MGKKKKKKNGRKKKQSKSQSKSPKKNHKSKSPSRSNSDNKTQNKCKKKGNSSEIEVYDVPPPSSVGQEPDESDVASEVEKSSKTASSSFIEVKYQKTKKKQKSKL